MTEPVKCSVSLVTAVASCRLGGRHRCLVLVWVLCSVALQTRAKPYRSRWGSVLFLWSPYENALRQLAFEVLESYTGLQPFGYRGKPPFIHRRNMVYECSWVCSCAGYRRSKKILTSWFGIIPDSCKMPPWCVFLLQEVMLSQPKHRTAQRLRWVFSCPGQAEAWGWTESLLHGCVGKQPLALGEGPRLLLGPRQSKILFLPGVSQAIYLLRQVSCPRLEELFIPIFIQEV